MGPPWKESRKWIHFLHYAPIFFTFYVQDHGDALNVLSFTLIHVVKTRRSSNRCHKIVILPAKFKKNKFMRISDAVCLLDHNAKYPVWLKRPVLNINWLTWQNKKLDICTVLFLQSFYILFLRPTDIVHRILVFPNQTNWHSIVRNWRQMIMLHSVSLMTYAFIVKPHDFKSSISHWMSSPFPEQ